MNITKVQINRLQKPRNDNKGQLVAYATLTFDEIFVINSIKVFRQPEKDKIYIEMPKHPNGTDTRDTCFPISNVFRRKVENAIVKELNKFD